MIDTARAEAANGRFRGLANEFSVRVTRRCVCVGVPVAEASTVTWSIDFTSSRGSGFFEVDPTNFAIPATAAQPTTFSVVAADINITDPGWGLLGPIHYTLDNLLGTSCAPLECSLKFGTQVVVPTFGTYHPQLQLNKYGLSGPTPTSRKSLCRLLTRPLRTTGLPSGTCSEQLKALSSPFPSAARLGR